MAELNAICVCSLTSTGLGGFFSFLFVDSMIGALVVSTEYFMILITEQLLSLAFFVYEFAVAIGIFVESLVYVEAKSSLFH